MAYLSDDTGSRNKVSGNTVSYKTWHIPFEHDALTLESAHKSMQAVRAGEGDIPLMVQLVENPKYRVPGIRLFHGAVDLLQHDYIHIVLGRGLLAKDEAFTVGFTMGTTNKVTTTEETLYATIAKNLYPKVYQFDDDDIEVFKNAVRLGYISSCQALDQFDFYPYLKKPLKILREDLGLEKELLLAYYRIEKARYPYAPECRRLLD
jgi:hypothetical protein